MEEDKDLSVMTEVELQKLFPGKKVDGRFFVLVNTTNH